MLDITGLTKVEAHFTSGVCIQDVRDTIGSIFVFKLCHTHEAKYDFKQNTFAHYMHEQSTNHISLIKQA